MGIQRTSKGWGSLIAGSFAIGLILAGLMVFIEQLLYWLRWHDWETITLRWFFLDRMGSTSIPLISRLLQRSPALHDLVVQFLELIPLWLFLGTVGSVIAFRAARERRW